MSNRKFHASKLLQKIRKYTTVPENSRQIIKKDKKDKKEAIQIKSRACNLIIHGDREKKKIGKEISSNTESSIKWGSTK